jgi:hypothetical protein
LRFLIVFWKFYLLIIRKMLTVNNLIAWFLVTRLHYTEYLLTSNWSQRNFNHRWIFIKIRFVFFWQLNFDLALIFLAQIKLQIKAVPWFNTKKNYFR